MVIAILKHGAYLVFFINFSKNADNEIKITFKVVIAKHIKWMQLFVEELHEL